MRPAACRMAWVVGLVALVATSSCGEGGAGRGASDAAKQICRTPPPLGDFSGFAETNAMPDGPKRKSAEATNARLGAAGCVHRSAYSLAVAPDPASLVARAVMQACKSEISEAVLSTAEADAHIYEKAGAAGFSQVQAEVREELERAALLHVIEARAGDCSAG